jgi:alkylation response protein AidB-like acyl-CoA dehydrogenase
VRFELDEQQAALRDEVVRVVADAGGPLRARGAFAAGIDHELWGALVDLGVPGTPIPEQYGGLGLGLVEAAAILEGVAGQQLVAPLRTTWDAAALLTTIGGDATGELLARIVEGERAAIVRPTGATLDGHLASILLFTAPDGSVGWCDATAPAVEVTRVPCLDPSSPLARIAARGPATPLAGPGAVDAAAPRMWVHAAADALGTGQRALDLAVTYAGARVQFGRPIGSFQAIKHKLADAYTALSGARSAVWAGAWTVENDPHRATSAARLALVTATEAAFSVAAAGLQVHGGIGFTEEHDAQLLLKRARTLLVAHGDPTSHRAAWWAAHTP